MWYLWTALLLVSRALVAAEGEPGAEAAVEAAAQATTTAPRPATTRAPHRTLDRQAAELAWRTWLQSPESGNPNAPPRRITTKSLFITPLVCPKGQRLDRNGCVQIVTVDKDEHERILLEQLNNLFGSSGPSGSDTLYDYGEDEPGPLQLSIPIGLDPQAAALQAQEPTAQAQEQQPNYAKVDKKDKDEIEADASLEAELELLKLQHSRNPHNDTTSSEITGILNHNVLNNALMPSLDKPKRDSTVVNSTEMESITNKTDEGEKEVIFGHVNIDPVLLSTGNQAANTETETEKHNEAVPAPTNLTVVNNNTAEILTPNSPDTLNKTTVNSNVSTNVLKKDGEHSKLNPENDYADIGEAIKLISRYAEVTTDDNFNKDQKKYAIKDDSILGTRTKLQHRRNKLKPEVEAKPSSAPVSAEQTSVDNIKPIIRVGYPKNEVYYRYPWQGQHSPTPPPDYPFRHLQDYWPGRIQVGGVYNTAHENPRRHHHTYPHNYFKPRSAHPSYSGPFPGLRDGYVAPLQAYPNRAALHHARPIRSHSNNQDLYTLLGLRHWFSSEGTSKR